MVKITAEMMEKAKRAESAEHLQILAKEGGMEITLEEAKEYFGQLKAQSGELADEELDAVAGGGCEKECPYRRNIPDDCQQCGRRVQCHNLS